MSYHEAAPAFRRHISAMFAGSRGIAPCVLEQERRLADAIKSSGLASRLRHLEAGIHDVELKANEPFELFVMGEGKFGKSTLVNALLGAPIAPTDFLPKTWCFNRYVAEPEPRQHVRVFVDENLRINQRCGHLDALGRPCGGYRNLTEYRLDRSAAERLAKEEERRVTETFGQANAYWSPIMEMEWSVPCDRAILPGIRLVDTMGIDQRLAPKSHQHHLKWQYERADAVLWLVSREKIGAGATRKEISEARRYAKLVYVLITRWDQVRDRAEALRLCEHHYGDLASAIVPVCAPAWLLAQAGEDWIQTSGERELVRRLRQLGSDELLDLSGMVALRDQLDRFLDGRQAYHRNAQVYSALRQKDRELRSIALAARSDAEANLELYQELKERLSQAAQTAQDLIESSLTENGRTWSQQVTKGLLRITYDNRHEARSILALDRVTNEISETQERLARDATTCFRDLVTWANGGSRGYVLSEFAPTGSVADRLLTASATETEVRITASKPEFEWQDPTGFWTEAKILAVDALSHIPLVGDLFAEKARQLKADAADDFRANAREPILQQLQACLAEAHVRLVSRVQVVETALHNDITRQYDLTGGDAAHQQAMERIDAVLSRNIVEPLLVAIPLRLMRKLEWRR
ncbi:MAG: hypothetical protein GX446_15495 [Chthonomonadales bacterium]|nr:hypothetical protein [Chthonomonadales bacterium]